MRKILSVLLIVFAITVVVTSSVFAQDATSSSAAQQVSYDMPYPGLLPDNPLYMFKTLRDKIVGFLIADNAKRVEFDLLNSDKRMSSGVALVNKGKYDLGITTISKSNNYFYESLQALNKIKQSGQESDLLVLKLSQAAQKHTELLNGVQKKIPASLKGAYSHEQARLEEFQKQLTIDSK